MDEMEKLRKQLKKLINEEKRYLGVARSGSKIDYSMGKLRAFEKILGMIE